MKCVFCKFDNTIKEFDRHKSHTSFSAVDRAAGAVARFVNQVLNNDEAARSMICEPHQQNVRPWMEVFWKRFDELKKGVMLAVIKTR